MSQDILPCFQLAATPQSLKGLIGKTRSGAGRCMLSLVEARERPKVPFDAVSCHPPRVRGDGSKY